MSVEPSSIQDYLKRQIRRTHEQYLAAREDRIAVIRYARAAGLTYGVIAEHVGMTESGVRLLLKRSDDAA